MFILNKLTLVGHDKNYTVDFLKGLNIIHGDSDTGKSTVLELIDYCLGNMTLNLYDEIEIKGKYCLLEISTFDKVITVKRDIFYPNKFIEVYQNSINEYFNDDQNGYPKLLGPNFKTKGPSGYFSDYMLETLNIPKVKIKKAPSKDDSATQRLSIRDLMHYSYLTQDDIGSKHLLDSNIPAKSVINSQVFKFFNKILDDQITELDAAISKETTLNNKMKTKRDVINSFLEETQIADYETLLNLKQKFKTDFKICSEELEVIDTKILKSSKIFLELREDYTNLSHKFKDNELNIVNSKNELEEYIKLKNNYGIEIEKMDSTLKTYKAFSTQKELNINCPLCDSKINFLAIENEYENKKGDILKRENLDLKIKYKNIETLIEKKRFELMNKIKEKNEIQKELENLGDILDHKSKNLFHPILI